MPTAPGSVPGPFFSVLVTAYDRAELAVRCVRSCTAQTFGDFEIVLVDDGSSDGTGAALAGLGEPRLRVVRHERNQGTSAARATAFDNARGEWIVVVDSDDELLPHALARLRELIAELPEGVRMIRSRHRLDDGSLAPGLVPQGVTDYRGRLDWLEAVAAAGVNTDAGHCMHRSVLERCNYFRDRRGAIEALWELSLARTEPSLWVSDVLGLVHTDAPDRYSLHAGAGRVVKRLRRDAPDQRWMAETMLAEHGRALAEHAPTYLRWLLEFATLQSLLAGDRRAGVRHARGWARAGAPRPKLAATLALGMLGPGALGLTKALGRQWRARQAPAA